LIEGMIEVIIEEGIVGGGGRCRGRGRGGIEVGIVGGNSR
jgi:hypothetical protein